MFILTKTGHWLPTETRYLLTIEGDGGNDPASNGGGTNGAGGDNGADGGSGASSGTQPNWAQFTDSLNQLNETLGGKLDTLVGHTKALGEQVQQPAQQSEPTDLEAMSRAEFAAHIVSTITTTLNEQIKGVLDPVLRQVNDVQTTVAQQTVTEQVAKLRSEHKDFNDWKTEMVEAAKQHPTLGVSQLYHLARAENPAKAGELDKKYAPPVAPPPPRFGGLTPAMSANGGGKPALTSEQAGREAYREVAARHPGVLQALQDL